jgi:hypothetical protein
MFGHLENSLLASGGASYIQSFSIAIFAAIPHRPESLLASDQGGTMAPKQIFAPDEKVALQI